jgi:hypothetical protein
MADTITMTAAVLPTDAQLALAYRGMLEACTELEGNQELLQELTLCVSGAYDARSWLIH